ncbi:MAG: hypothetical protein WB439_12215 [Acidobacteriaceae bacterium]
MGALATIWLVTRDRYDWIAYDANLLLVAVGICGVVVGVCTVLFVKRQVVEMRRQRVAMQQTLQAINKQADLMKQQMDMQIAKERAVIQVEAMEIPAPVQVDLPPPPYDVVRYKVFNRGLVAARIVYAYAIVDIADTSEQCTGERSTFSGSNFGMNLDSLFPATADGVTRYAISEVRFPWEDINDRKKFIHFHGVIKYQDLLSDQDRGETAFHYVWWIDSQRLADGSIFGHWVERGDKNDNRQT